MRFLEFRHRRIGFSGREFNRPTQCLAPHLRQLFSHLIGQAEEHRLLERVALQMLGVDQAFRPLAGFPIQQRAHDAFERENREQGDDVGKALVKRRLVRGGRLEVTAAQAVEDGVRRLVGDHVVRQAGEDRAVVRAGEVAEQNGSVGPGIKRVGLCEGMRCDVNLMAIGAPGNSASQSGLETGQRAHDYGVNVLGVEPRIAQNCRVVPLHRLCLVRRQDHRRLVERVVRDVVVDDADAIASWAGSKLLCRNIDVRSQYPSSNFDGWILCNNGQRSGIGEAPWVFFCWHRNAPPRTMNLLPHPMHQDEPRLLCVQ